MDAKNEEIKKRNEPYKKIARRYETGQIGFYDALHEAYHLDRGSEWVDVKRIDAVKSLLEISKLDGSSGDYITGVQMCLYVLTCHPTLPQPPKEKEK